MIKNLLVIVVAVLFLSGCATTRMTNASNGDIPLILAYPGPEVIKEQSRVASLCVAEGYGLAIDGTPIKEQTGALAPGVRASKNGYASTAIVDLLPGKHTLTATYKVRRDQNLSVQTAETSYIFEGGQIYVLGLNVADNSITIMAPDGESRTVLPRIVSAARSGARF